MLSDWRNEISSSDLILLSAPSFNRHYFIFEKSILQKNDPRIQSIPFTTHRPTLVEIQRIHQWISTLQFFAEDTSKEEEEEVLGQIDGKDEEEEGNSSDEDKQVAETEEQDLKSSSSSITSSSDLYLEAIRENDLEMVKKLYEEDYIRPIPADATQICGSLYLACSLGHLEIAKYLIEVGDDLNVQIPCWKFRTALHCAALKGLEELIPLMLERGVDPTIKGFDSKTAYDVSKNKRIRDIFRRFDCFSSFFFFLSNDCSKIDMQAHIPNNLIIMLHTFQF